MTDLRKVFGITDENHDQNRYPNLPDDGTFVAPPGYKAYHGTMKKNWASIKKNGLSGRDEQNTVCFTENPEVCEDYGDLTIEADLSGLQCMRFYDEGEDGGVWEVQTAGPVPSSRLKIWNGQ